MSNDDLHAALMALLRAARDLGPPLHGTMRPSAVLGGIEIVASGHIPPGVVLPLGPMAFAVSATDYTNATARTPAR